jgi:hypothetical protein
MEKNACGFNDAAFILHNGQKIRATLALKGNTGTDVYQKRLCK